MPATLSPQDFVAKWKQSTLRERASSQEHFIDVCRLIGHATPAEADPSGTWYAFEAGATKQSGGDGWADVWKKGCFAWEYKGKHANLDRAYDQLLQYKDSLENPPLLIVSDIERIRVYTNFTNTVKKIYEITLSDLLKPESLRLLRDAFTNPDALRSPQTTEQVTQQAAAEFGRLAEILRKWGAEPHAAAHFLIRILFCLFAEDADLLPKSIFTRLVTQARHRPAAFRQQLVQLFTAMTSGGFFGSDEVPHFDGGLFDDSSALDMDSDALDILVRVSGLDWSGIKPSIFGTLFERSLDPSKRAQLGAHYTGEEDILLIVEPVLMAPLCKRWAEVQAQAHELAARRDAAKGAPRAKLEKELFALLRGFRNELAATRVLDAACGSGNFLYIALRLLLDLEKEVINLAGAFGDSGAFPAVSTEQLHGIEINPYAHELAQVTVWIGYIQWLRENGFGVPSEPILKPLHNILLMDAILAYDEQGKPVEPEWPEADVIIGNPPFLGDKKMRRELGDKYVEELRKLYEGGVPGGADLVTYWFERARALIAAGRLKRAGLLATNSIRQQGNRPVLERIKETGGIFMAWSDRPWILDGAAVRVSMVGFDDGSEVLKNLDSLPVAEIFADLSAGVDASSALPLPENAGLCFLGMMKAGPFDIDANTAHAMLRAPINPNGRTNSDVVRRRLGGQDVVHRQRDGWIVDFVQMSESEAALYEMPFEYVRQHVKPIRDTNRRERTRQRWWLYGETRPGLRRALTQYSRCIVTPEVSRHRVFIWMDTAIVPDHKLHVVARDDDYFLGVLQSRVHEIWTLAQCAWLGVGNDPSYSSSRTFETFPFPWPPGKEPQDDPRVQAITEAARDLVAKRGAWLNPPGAAEAELKKRTLTNLYNQRPTWLDLAHRKLDAAVLDAYGWPHELGDDEMLARLLALNLERASAAQSQRQREHQVIS
jgi:type II restriction/modification system DNA methylase subunit YeeA